MQFLLAVDALLCNTLVMFDLGLPNIRLMCAKILDVVVKGELIYTLIIILIVQHHSVFHISRLLMKMLSIYFNDAANYYFSLNANIDGISELR
jgi:hypothetical protein